MSLRVPMPASLVGRVALWASLLLVVAVLLFWSLFTAAADRVAREVVDARLVQFAEQLRGYRASRAASGEPLGDASQIEAGPGPETAAGGADIGWVWQITEPGKVVGRSQLLRLTNTYITPAVYLPSPDFTLTDLPTPLGPMRIAQRIVEEAPPFAADNGGAPIRVHYLVGVSVEQYTDDVAQLVARLRHLFLLALIPVSLAVLGMLAVIVIVLQRHLGRLTTAIGQYEAGDTAAIEGRFPRELQRPVDRVNGLLNQNLLLIDRTRKYVSKIAHDVNHPLAIMKNALDGNVDTGLIRRQVDRMAGLVDRYSSLARAIGPDSHIQRRTDVADLLQDVAEGFSILYRRTPLEIAWECPDGLTFAVARHDLEAMVSNLLSNAHKFADSRVEIGARIDDGTLCVSIEDDGPGISPEERAAALNWGKRLDEAPPGTGFGLSIVADIVALYDGEIRLEEAGLGGLRVEILLPGGGG
jgi:signal transduction histidine kinase